MTDGFDPDVEIAHTLDGRAEGITLAQLRASPDCVKILDPDGRIEYMSRNAMCAMEIAAHSSVAGKAWWTLWPISGQQRVRDAVRRALDGETDRFEADCPTGTGTMKRWSVKVRPVHDGSGRVDKILSSSREVPQDGGAAIPG